MLMRLHRLLTAVAAVVLIALSGAIGGSAFAAFPDFTGCPTGLEPGSGCLDVQSQEGETVIKGFRVPLDHSLELRGAIRNVDGVFLPATGTNGFIAQPVNVPGGLLGIELPIGLNRVAATAELAGPSSSIHFQLLTQEITMPIKLRLSNPLIGSNCHIGTNSNPVMLHLTTGTTSPPPPNRPISGRPGTISFEPETGIIFVRGTVDVDNSFSVPGASGCGGLGLIDLLIDAKLQIPSAAGNNAITVENEAAIRTIQ
jgi:hypothetical protein